jgi:hypothetical protein
MFYEANREFHEAIYEAANSEFISDQTLALRNRVSPYRRYITFQPGRMAATIGEHEAVMTAILDSNPLAAQQANRDHVILLGDNLTDFIASIPAETLRPSGARGRLAKRIGQSARVSTLGLELQSGFWGLILGPNLGPRHWFQRKILNDSDQ